MGDYIKIKKVWINIGIAMTSIIFLLLLLEFITRVVAYRVGRGFFEKPLSFISSFFTIYDWPAPYKEKGYYIFKKGEKISKVKPKGALRIICFGGSTTLDPYSEKKLGYPYLLQKKLSHKYPLQPIEVLNAGGDGFSSAHTLVNFALRNLELKPDIIIIYHNINDLSANYYGSEVSSDYSNKYLTYDFLAYRHRHGFWGSLMKYSYLARYINAKTSIFKFRDVDRKRGYEKGMEYFRNNLRSIIAIAKANNIYPIIATQAARSDLRKDGGFSEYNLLIKDVAQKEGVVLVDAAEMITDDKCFFDEIHLNLEGIRCLQEAFYNPIVSYIEKRLIYTKKEDVSLR